MPTNFKFVGFILIVLGILRRMNEWYFAFIVIGTIRYIFQVLMALEQKHSNLVI